MTDYFSTPIFVLGLPRSGTSMIAGSLARCGAWTGQTIPGVAGENPRGFYEHGIIREGIIKQLLRQLNCDPAGVVSLPPAGLTVRAPGLADVFRNTIQADGYMNDRPWLYKDAKLSLLWPLVANAFPQATWLIVNRKPQAVIDSCLRTSFMRQHSSDPAFWENFVNAYEQRLDALRKSGQRVLEIHAEDPINGKLEPLRELCGQLELEFNGAAVGEFISPAFWHDGPGFRPA